MTSRPRIRFAAPLACAAALTAASGAGAEGLGLFSGLRSDRPASAAPAAFSGQAGETRSQLALMRGWEETPGLHVAALDIRLADGWKTYWRVPGDAGIPPHFDWTGSENVAAVEVRWPAPIAFDTYGMTTLGYAEAVTLPLRVRAADPSRPVTLQLDFAYGLCADICIPAQASLNLEMPAGADADAYAAQAISAALAAQPAAMDAAGIEVQACGLSGERDDRRLEAVFEMPGDLAAPPMAVVEGPESYWFHPADVAVDGREVRVTAVLDPASPGAEGGWLARDALRVTLLAEGGAVETAGCAG
ncbi:MAG: protein-disulfide reductase DsbD domain-containing protein [Pseudomonadota bacterium]